MNPQTLLDFEQVLVDAEQAAADARVQAREAAKAERANRKHQEELDKSHRRLQRDMARRYREPDEHAQCGIRWYCRSPRDRDTGAYWHHCHTCGQALVYTADRSAKPQECKGRKP